MAVQARYIGVTRREGHAAFLAHADEERPARVATKTRGGRANSRSPAASRAFSRANARSWRRRTPRSFRPGRPHSSRSLVYDSSRLERVIPVVHADLAKLSPRPVWDVTAPVWNVILGSQPVSGGAGAPAVTAGVSDRAPAEEDLDRVEVEVQPRAARAYDGTRAARPELGAPIPSSIDEQNPVAVRVRICVDQEPASSELADDADRVL